MTRAARRALPASPPKLADAARPHPLKTYQNVREELRPLLSRIASEGRAGAEIAAGSSAPATWATWARASARLLGAVSEMHGDVRVLTVEIRHLRELMERDSRPALGHASPRAPRYFERARRRGVGRGFPQKCGQFWTPLITTIRERSVSTWAT